MTETCLLSTPADITEGVWSVGSGSPFPLGRGLNPGEAVVPFHRKYFDIKSPNGDFWCILVVFFLQFSCLFYTQKLVLLGFHNLPLQFTVVRQADDIMTDGLTSHHNTVSLTDSYL